MNSDLTIEAQKIIKRWTAGDFYVYLRPISSKYHDPKKNHRIYWAVSVECRMGDVPMRFREEGYVLSDLITKLDLQVPRRPAGYKVERPQSYTGWLVPEAEQRRQRALAAPPKRRRRPRSG